MSTQTITLDEFIERHGLTMDAEYADTNPNMTGMPPGSMHWLCTIRRGGETMAVPFSQGPAHTEPPTAADVLNCLASDASSIENAPDWLDWAEEMGFGDEGASGMRKARDTYQAIERQSADLRELLGGDAFEVLLWHTERL